MEAQGGGQEQGVVKGVALEDAVRVEEGVGAEQTQGTRKRANSRNHNYMKELVDHLPSVGCKHCIKGDPPQPVAVHNHWLTGGLLLRFGLLGKEGGIIGIRT